MSRTADLPALPISAAAPRIGLVDLARGVALLAMFIYHFAWDLFWLRFIATDVALHPGWRAFSHAIAASFLMLAGLSLGLAHAKAFKARPFFRRLAVIGLAALGVSVATFFAVPDAWVAFGILHCIAAGSLLAAAFLNRPWWAALLAAGLVAALPTVADLPALAGLQERVEVSPLFWAWQHLGLARVPPISVDFVPLFPWAGYLLAGLAAGLALARGAIASRLAAVGLPLGLRPVAMAGRRSLPIYLLHQPVLIGALMLVAWLAPGLTISVERQAQERFRQECVAECSRTRARAGCLEDCQCVVDQLGREPTRLRQAIGVEASDAGTDEAIAESARMCFRPVP